MIHSSIVFLPVSDIKRTVEFYTKTIGLKLWKDFGSCVILSTNSGYWGFCQYDDGRELPKNVCLSLNCTDRNDVDEQYRRLCALGVKTNGEPCRHSLFPVYSFFLCDPDGYTVEFQKIDGE